MAAIPTELGFAEINGARLYYEVTGAGHPLTLVHAGIADHRMWDDQVADFAARYRVIRYDLRGFGQSTLPPGPYSMQDDLRALLASLGVTQTHLLGCSIGGGVTIDFTLTHPDQVSALIAVGAGMSGFEPPQEAVDEETKIETEIDAALKRGDIDAATEWSLRMWVDGPRRTPDQVSAAVRERAREMNRLAFVRGPEFEATQGQHIDPPAAGRLGEIHAPTLVIYGSGDQSTVSAFCEAIAHGVPGARKVIMPGLGHIPNMEQPAEFNRIVLDFLAQAGG